MLLKTFQFNLPFLNTINRKTIWTQKKKRVSSAVMQQISNKFMQSKARFHLMISPPTLNQQMTQLMKIDECSVWELRIISWVNKSRRWLMRKDFFVYFCQLLNCTQDWVYKKWRSYQRVNKEFSHLFLRLQVDENFRLDSQSLFSLNVNFQ